MTTPGRVQARVDRATAYQPVGWGGSTSVVRFVGGTEDGTPTTGTYQAGDVVVGKSGRLHVCRVGGAPGSWSSTVTNNLDESISGTKTFTVAPEVPSLVINGFTITAIAGVLYINGVALATSSHNHDGFYSGVASDATNVDHTH